MQFYASRWSREVWDQVIHAFAARFIHSDVNFKIFFALSLTVLYLKSISRLLFGLVVKAPRQKLGDYEFYPCLRRKADWGTLGEFLSLSPTHFTSQVVVEKSRKRKK